MRNGKINPITTGNEFQRVHNTGSIDGISKDGRVGDGPIAETSLIKQDQKRAKRKDRLLIKYNGQEKEKSING